MLALPLQLYGILSCALYEAKAKTEDANTFNK